jgi:hypothetical protein
MVKTKLDKSAANATGVALTDKTVRERATNSNKNLLITKNYKNCNADVFNSDSIEL